MAGEDSVSLDSILVRLGQWRLYNQYNFLLACLPVFFTGMYGTNYVFLAADVPYRCLVPECELASDAGGSFHQPWLQHALPAGDARAGADPRCYRRAPAPSQPAGGVCDNSSFSAELVPCQEWVYASNNTIVAEFGLACQEWKRTLVGTAHNFGMLVSLPIIGLISDRSGRKMALTLSAVLVSAFGLLKSFASSYEMYVVCELLETIAGSSVYPSAFVLIIELLGHDRRVVVSLILGVALASGSAALSLLDLAVGYWRTWARVAYPPSVLFVLYIFILPESIRWLMAKGRTDEAIKIIKKAAHVNSITIPEDTIQKLILSREDLRDTAQHEKRSLFVEVVKSPLILRRLLICATWWMTAVFVFYGLAVHSASLPGDKHLNYVLLAVMEIIAITVNTLTLDRVGRKLVLLTAFLVCGVACISLPFLPLPWMTTTFFLVGKVAITMTLNGLYIYTSELFPTSARHSLLAFCSMTGRVGALIAPQMPLLATYMESLPSVLFGSLPILSALLMVFMPETLNTALPDTIAEAESLAHQPRPAADKC